MKTTHLLKVLGRELPIVSSAPAEKVQAVESYVNERLREISASLSRNDQELVLILALLNITEELLDVRSLQKKDTTLDDRVRGMLDRLQSA
jgi:cell division protein ZapA